MKLWKNLDKRKNFTYKFDFLGSNPVSNKKVVNVI